MMERDGEQEEEKEERQVGGGEERHSSRVCCRHEKPPLPHEHPLPPGKRERIDKVAKFVASEGDVQAEEILVKLLRLTGNHERWGFLSPDHPHHAYYVNRKMSERRRLTRQ